MICRTQTSQALGPEDRRKRVNRTWEGMRVKLVHRMGPRGVSGCSPFQGLRAEPRESASRALGGAGGTSAVTVGDTLHPPG